MSTVSRTAARLADEALQPVAEAAQTVQQQATPALVRVAEQAGALLERGAEAVRDGSRQLRESAASATDRTVDYIRDEPVKAVLIAAAGGAALMALAQLVARTRRPA